MDASSPVPQDSPWSVRRLNVLAELMQARSYLEIGVFRGTTFNAIRVPERTGVDPWFSFDTSTYDRPGITFAKMTSDAFFSVLPATAQFDLIFLDGLHTFTQTYRDLCNALAHSHHGTVILIDDVMPTDVYSSLPDRERALRYRRAAGNDRKEWHGDVYKIIFAVHDFHLGLQYRTIVGSGNPQALVWYGAGDRRVPLLDSLETISRMTFFDAMDHEEAYRAAGEAEAIDACVTALAKN